MNRLVVSTECPTCGAPLDFGEGSNAVQCLHCRSQLLVTGRKRVLSYYVAPKVEAREAAVKVMCAQQEAGQRCRISKVERYFIPYYRLTGDDLRWEKAEAPAPADSEDGQLLPLDLLSLRQRPSFGDDDEAPLSLHDRYIERSFIACQLPEAGLYSLGIRPAVLRLLLFQGSTVRALGKVVAPDVGAEAALARGMKVAEIDPILQRRVIGSLLSLVYFPYWVVEVERREARVLSLVDAVSAAIPGLGVGARLYDVLNRDPAADPPSVGFRPLVCPNCGADLPVRPDDIIFFCASCESAWEIEGEELRAVTYEIGVVPGAAAGAVVKYLPFWRLEVDAPQGSPSRFFLPGFRCRRLKILVDLARALSEHMPAGGGAFVGAEVHGCHYDRDDARLLAELTYPELRPRPRRAVAELQERRLQLRTAVLVWLPFEVRGQELIDCCTGHAVSQQLLS